MTRLVRVARPAGATPNTLVQGNNAVLLVELNGAATALGVDGLTVTAPGSTVRGLVVNRFGRHGITLNPTAGNTTVAGNFVGTDPTGTQAKPNRADGVLVNGAFNCGIGGTAPGDRNLVSGKAVNGIQVTGLGASNGTNRIQGNTVGGTAAGARNLISGNGDNGVGIVGTTGVGNVVQGNVIGTDVTGSGPLGNGSAGIGASSGVGILNGTNNRIGGPGPGKGNVIAANVLFGVITDGGGGNLIQGNRIGTNAAGTATLGTQINGVVLLSWGNTVGGPAAGNLISGHRDNGVFVVGTNAAGNVIQGNFVGTDATGTLAVPNGFNGIYVSAADTVIGLVRAGG